jgi:hypothetical protein
MTTPTTWYLRIMTPPPECVIHLWLMGPHEDPGQLVALYLDEARAEVGCPDNWWEEWWDVATLSAPIHPDMLAVAIMHQPLGGED